MKNQKEATFAAICAVMSNHGHTYVANMSVKEVMTKDLRAEVRTILVDGFKAGEIELDTEFATEELLNSYTSGLISNWIRKDTRLNGGGKYVPKNEGSRTGSSDPQLKNLKILLGQAQSDDDKAEIQGYIDTRVEEIAKSKQKPVDFAALPEALRAKFQKQA